MDESRISLKEQERADLSGKVARVLEAADEENRPLTGIEDAAVMEIVREAQRLERESSERYGNKQKRHGAAIEIKERQRTDLLDQIAKILGSSELTAEQEAEITEKTQSAHDLEAEICELSKNDRKLVHARLECCG
jgi:hypothetical protein